MNSVNRLIIKDIVGSRITELEKQLALSINSSQTVLLDQTAAGRVSRIDAIQQQKMASSSMVRDKKLLLVLENIQLKLLNDEGKDESDFGYCEECDEAILLARLKINPESKFCIDCQSRIE